MRNFMAALATMSIGLFVAGGTTACATKKYVRTSVGEVNDKVDSLGRSVEQTQERTRQNEAKIAEVDTKAQNAANSAQQATAPRHGAKFCECREQRGEGRRTSWTRSTKRRAGSCWSC